jgi:hypothetical protein
MNPLPLPVRIAAGLVATAVEQARELPRLVVEFPVTAISQALQASMRMQQRVTELAIKGDRALSVLRPAEEEPAWATFDDEVETPGRNGASTVTELRPAARPAPPRRPSRVADGASSPVTGSPVTGSPVTGSTSDGATVAEPEAAESAAAGTETGGTTASGPNPAESSASSAKASAAKGATAARTRAATAKVSQTRRPGARPADRKPAAQPPAADEPTANDPTAPGPDQLADSAPRTTAADVAARNTASVAAAEQPTDTGSGSDDASGPNIMPGLRDMTIPQLRARLRKLNEGDLRILLAWETAHENRPPFVTMLSNRITTVTEG